MTQEQAEKLNAARRGILKANEIELVDNCPASKTGCCYEQKNVKKARG